MHETARFLTRSPVVMAALIIGCGGFDPQATLLQTQGSLRSTGGTTDLAISGPGYLQLRQGSHTSYTRDGHLAIDPEGFLSSLEGARVQGFPADAAGAYSSSSGELQVGMASSPAVASRTITLAGNLAADAVILAEPFDLANPVTTSNFKLGLSVFDAGGLEHTIQVYFVKTAAGSWDFHLVTDGGGLTGGDSGVSSEIGTGALSFESSGVLHSGTQTSSFTWAGESAQVSLRVEFGDPASAGGTGTHGLTQFGGTGGLSFATFSGQDGWPAGSLMGVQIDDFGAVTGTFTNGRSRALGRVGLALMIEAEAVAMRCSSLANGLLAKVPPALGAPGSGGRGVVISGALEEGLTSACPR